MAMTADYKRMRLVLTVEVDVEDESHPDGGYCEEKTFEFPARYEVCHRCRGRGVHDPDGFSDGFTAEDFEEAGPDFKEEYMSSYYDVQCSVCHGQNVELVRDENITLPPETLEALEGWEAYQYECAQEAAMRRRGIQF